MLVASSAYYPTEVPLHRRSEFLGERDLFGDLARAAHDDGIVVFARMDSNGAAEAMYRAHPDWFTRKADGQPYFRDETLYAPCINGPYYREHIPAILREIATRYRPEGFTDNSWSGLSRGSICYCVNCRARFKRRAGSSCQRARLECRGLSGVGRVELRVPARDLGFVRCRRP